MRAARVQFVRRMTAGRNRNRSRAAGQRDPDIERRIADDDGIGSVRAQTAETFDRRQRDRQSYDARTAHVRRARRVRGLQRS